MKRAAVAVFCTSLVMTTACQKKERYPGFTFVVTAPAGQKIYIEPSSAKWVGEVVQFRQLTEATDGTYVIQSGETNCGDSITLSEGTRFSKDGRPLGSAYAVSVKGIVPKVCQSAERGFSGAFSTAEAMRVIFGSFDEKSRLSLWIANSVPPQLESLNPDTRMYSYPLGTLSYSEKGIEKLALVVGTAQRFWYQNEEAEYLRWDVHRCNGVCVVGAYIFVRSKGGWRVEAGSRYAAKVEGDVDLPRQGLDIEDTVSSPSDDQRNGVRLVKLGKDRFAIGVVASAEGGRGGPDSRYEYWLVPWGSTVGLGLMTKNTEDVLTSTARLIPSDKEYFDVELIRKGNDEVFDYRNVPWNRVISVDEKKLLTFRDGKYM